MTFSSCTVKVSVHVHNYPAIVRFCPVHKFFMNIENHTTVNVHYPYFLQWSSSLHSSVNTRVNDRSSDDSNSRTL